MICGNIYMVALSGFAGVECSMGPEMKIGFSGGIL